MNISTVHYTHGENVTGRLYHNKRGLGGLTQCASREPEFSSQPSHRAVLVPGDLMSPSPASRTPVCAYTHTQTHRNTHFRKKTTRIEIFQVGY